MRDAGPRQIYTSASRRRGRRAEWTAVTIVVLSSFGFLLLALLTDAGG